MALPVIPRPPSFYRDQFRIGPTRLLCWTLPRRYHELMARIGHTSLSGKFRDAGAEVSEQEGERIEHTAVTTCQLALLLKAVTATDLLQFSIIEIGSYRGATTRALAAATSREVVAIDPYVGDGGHQRDLQLFEQHTVGLSNVRMLREPSDRGFDLWGKNPVSLVFIDAIHEYVHAWYDFAAWGSLVPVGGMVAFHDVDQFPGVNRVCQKILRDHPEWQPWGYAPNIAIFQRQS